MAKSPDFVEKELKEFVALIRKTYDIYAVVLYGSYAEGRANDDSDIDVAVFSDDFGKDPYEEMKALFRLRRQIDTDIEPLPFSRDAYFSNDKTEFVSNIIRKGKVIYKENRLLI
jgi:predicted nucleotidyltransferase